MSHPCTCLKSRKKDNICKSDIKRTEWKTITWFVFGIGIWNLRDLKSKKLTTSKMEPFLMFNKSRLLSYHFLDLALFFVHFLDFSRDLQTVYGTRKVILKVYEERMLVKSLWTMKQNRRNSFENCKCIIDECIWFCYED